MLGLAVAALAAGCISSPLEPQEATVEPTSVTITPEALAPTGGTLERFSARVLDAQGKPISGSSVTWTSDDESVAIVDQSGYVWTFTEGTAMATADFPGKGKGAGNGNAYGHSKQEAQISVTTVAVDRPAQVTDLSVASTTTSSATLSFTEVGDGTGSPADYVVRFQVSPLDWGTATNVQSGTCSAPMDGGSTGSNRTCTVTNLQPDTNYQFQLVAFRGTYPSDVVYGDLSNKASGSTPAEPEPTQQPQPAGGGSEGHPNEPAGYQLISASTVDCVPGLTSAYCATAGDWSTRDNANIGVTDVTTSTGSPPSVLRTRFPAGLNPGTAPTQIDTWDNLSNPTRMRELYLSEHIRLVGDANGRYEFYSGVNKLGFFGYAGSTPSDGVIDCRPDTQGAGTGIVDDHCTLRFTQQDNVSRTTSTGRRMQVGTWYHWEFQLVLNDPGSSNGIFRWWVDGALVLELTDVVYATDPSQAFFTYRWNPTWGGGTGHASKARDDYIDLDDLYVSGVPN